MQVILRQHVEHLGRRGEVVKVADGYARNYLLPRKLALTVTDANRRLIDRERQVVEAREAQEKEAAEAVAARVNGLDVTIARRVGETETLYGSVTAADITQALDAQQVTVEKRQVQLPEAIKQLGDFDVPVKLHRDVTATVKLHVVKEAS